MTKEPLVIVGSRLQALIFAISAGAIAVGLWGQLGPATLLAAVPLALAAVVTLHRRVVLHDDRAEIRHLLRSNRVVPRADLDAEAGHRYLSLRSDAATIRIEVPVEIRPEVRTWADGD